MAREVSAGIPKIRFPTYEFLALFLPIAVLALAVGFSFAWLRTESRIEELLDDDTSRLNLISGSIGAEIAGSLHHLAYLSSDTTLQRALDVGDTRSLNNLQAMFRTVARFNPDYRQLVWIDERGYQRLRVDSDGETARAAAEQDLRDASEQALFHDAMALLPGELYVSQIDLERDAASNGDTARATVRIATPVHDGRRRARGILVLSISMQPLLDTVGSFKATHDQVEYLLLNQHGVLLNSPVQAAVSERDTFDADFGQSRPKLWERVGIHDSGNLETWDGLWTWTRISPIASLKARYSGEQRAFDRIASDRFTVILLAHRPVATLIELRREVRMLVSLGVILGISVYGFALFLYLNGHVRARHAELSAAHAVARASHLAKMKELEQRFHRLVEASSIGQLLIDGEGQIEIANPAAEQMLGYDRGELGGQNVDCLLPASIRNRHAGLREHFLQSPVPRRMGAGRELAALRKDGSTIPVEIGLNPYTDNGRQLVLVSIIDRVVPQS